SGGQSTAFPVVNIGAGQSAVNIGGQTRVLAMIERPTKAGASNSSPGTGANGQPRIYLTIGASTANVTTSSAQSTTTPTSKQMTEKSSPVAAKPKTEIQPAVAAGKPPVAAKQPRVRNKKQKTSAVTTTSTQVATSSQF